MITILAERTQIGDFLETGIGAFIGPFTGGRPAGLDQEQGVAADHSPLMEFVVDFIYPVRYFSRVEDV